MTTESEAGAPEAVVITNVDPAATGQNSVTWTVPAQGRSPIIRYDIQFQNAGAFTPDVPAVGSWAGATILVGPPDLTTYVHMGLEGGARYYYRVRAVNTIGEGAFSVLPMGGNVPTRSPGVPMLTATSAGKNGIFLEWTVPANNGAAIDDYNLQRWNPPVGDTVGSVVHC